MRRSILFALPGFAFGGAERVAADIVAALHQADHHTIVAAIKRRPRAGHQIDSAAVWFAAHAATDRMAEAALPEAFRSLIESEGIDTLVLVGRSRVYAHLPALKAAFPALRVAAFMFNAKQLIWEHRRYGAYIDCVIAESADAARALNGEGDERLPIRIVSSGVDVRRLAERPTSRDPSPGLTVAYVGRFDRSKNPQGFIAMARRMPPGNLRFVMAGPAGHFRAPPHVRMLGLLVGEAKEAFLDSVDILVVPSLNDGRPLIIHEAQARGRVVVASRVGAIPELIEHDVSGLLVPPGDIDGLAAAVARLADDDSLRARLGAAGRARALIQGDLSVSMPGYLAAILGEDPPAAAQD
jgi:glycosyltransferase involved in cell wall biosynthesis